MPFVPATNVAEMALIYNWDSQLCANILHYQTGAGITAGVMNDIASQLVDWYDETLQAGMPTNLSLVEIRGTDLTTQTGPTITYSTDLPLAGTSPSPSLPNSVALVLTKRTAMRGRSFRGRVYLPGLTEDRVTGNTVSAGVVTSLVAAFNSILELDIGGIPATMVVVSRQANKEWRGAAVVTPVSNFTANPTVDSQRRRLPGRGA